jgi:copper transport protein
MGFARASTRRSRPDRIIRAALIACLFAMLAGGIAVERGAAHAELIRSDPPSEGLLTVPPQQLNLWFTETVSVGAGSPSIQVVDANGNDVPISNARIDPADSMHVLADIDGMLPGSYTVIWSVRSDTDGHTLSGTYSFRVGGGRAPGAATVEGETPPPWAVATRWLTFLGIGLTAAGFLFGMVITRGVEASRTTQRRRAVTIAGAAVALLATVSEPFLQRWWPPAGTIAPSLNDAIAGLPTAWWIRPAALLPAIVLATAAWRMRKPRTALDWIGGVVALSGLAGLSLTSHSAAERGVWRLPALASNLIHQGCIALWVGGLVYLVLWLTANRPPTSSGVGTEQTTDGPIRRFSRIALVLVAVGVATGVANAGLLLPTLRSLWTSDYGVVLLVKVGILTVPLALATFHQRAIRRAITRWWPTFQRTVRLEAILVLAVVLAGSTLALLAPPIVKSRVSVFADVPKPALDAYQGQDLLVHLLFSPGQSGENELGVRLSNYDRSAYSGDQPALIRLRLVSMQEEVVIGPYELQPAPDGAWTASPDAAFNFDGWWRIEATLRWLGQEDVIVPFYVMLPDPNLNGFDAPPIPESDPAAETLFNQAMTAYTSVNRVRYAQSMSSHTGIVAFAENVVNDGSDGSTPGYSYNALGGIEAVVLGTTGWLRQPGQDWRVIDVNPAILPSDWDEEYAGATGFQLGRIDEVNGEPAQVITFVVPGNGKFVTAWYVWWFGLTSGQVLRDVMVSNSHYMTSDFSGFNEPAPLAPPPGISATPST